MNGLIPLASIPSPRHSKQTYSTCECLTAYLFYLRQSGHKSSHSTRECSTTYGFVLLATVLTTRVIIPLVSVWPRASVWLRMGSFHLWVSDHERIIRPGIIYRASSRSCFSSLTPDIVKRVTFIFWPNSYVKSNGFSPLCAPLMSLYGCYEGRISARGKNYIRAFVFRVSGEHTSVHVTRYIGRILTEEKYLFIPRVYDEGDDQLSIWLLVRRGLNQLGVLC